MRPHSAHLTQQPVEVSVPSELQRKKAENTAHTQKLSWLHGNEMDNVFSGESLLRAKPKYSTIL